MLTSRKLFECDTQRGVERPLLVAFRSNVRLGINPTKSARWHLAKFPQDTWHQRRQVLNTIADYFYDEHSDRQGL
jgi:hypothetical protein